MKILTAFALISSALFALATANDQFVGEVSYFPANASNSTASAISGKFHTDAYLGAACLIAENIDITGTDMGSTKGDRSMCCYECQIRPACVGYVWTDFEGGTCWLKSSLGTARIYIGARGCRAGNDDRLSVARFANCDMPGNDLRSLQSADKAMCEQLCMDTLECKAMVWTNYQGGTCWLKKAVTNCAKYDGATATVVFNSKMIW